MTNLEPAQDAGSWQGQVDLESYISVRLAGQMNPSGKRGYLPETIIQGLVEMKA